MNISTFEIEGLILIEPRIFKDERGFFFESFNKEKYKEIIGSDIHFVQDNISSSKINVLRGLHFQEQPFSQGKLVTVIKGKVLDIAVDIRKGSPTFGKYQAIELSSENNLQFWIPPGFAHGFLTLEEDTVFSYKCSNYYSPKHEHTLLWDDPTLAIDWNVQDPIISEKDKLGFDFQVLNEKFN